MYSKIILIFIIFLPSILSAQGLIPCNGPECNLCHLLLLGTNVINFLILIAIPLSAIAFAYAGFLLLISAGSEEKIKRAHKIFLKVAIGLIIVLGAYLIANLFVKGLTDGNISEMFDCSTTTTTPDADAPVNDDEDLAYEYYTHSEAKAILDNYGIGIWSSGNCSDKNLPNCTSLDGIRIDTILHLVALKSECPGCNIIVTGGTEIGHAESDTGHSSGYKIDINKTYYNDPFSTYIENTMEELEPTANGYPRYKDSCNNIYLDEGNHWDIKVVENCL